MKKYFIFLLLIIAAEYVVAQQTERSSFRDFMYKRKEPGAGSEKSIVVTPNDNVTSHMFLPKVETKMGIPGLRNDLSNRNKIFGAPPDNIPFVIPKTNSAEARLSQVLPNGNKVYILPRDNMPCVVPDINSYNMPVAGGNLNSDKDIYVSPPKRIIPTPDKILPSQQQTTGKK